MAIGYLLQPVAQLWCVLNTNCDLSCAQNVHYHIYFHFQMILTPQHKIYYVLFKTCVETKLPTLQGSSRQFRVNKFNLWYVSETLCETGISYHYQQEVNWSRQKLCKQAVVLVSNRVHSQPMCCCLMASGHINNSISTTETFAARMSRIWNLLDRLESEPGYHWRQFMSCNLELVSYQSFWSASLFANWWPIYCLPTSFPRCSLVSDCIIR